MLEFLEQQLEQLKATERQAFANFNAALGARQFCEMLIAKVKVEQEEDAEHS